MSRKLRATKMAFGMSVLLGLAAGGAWAQSVEGVDVILKKNDVTKTLTLSRTPALVVGPNTQIRGENGAAIPFSALPSATPFGNGGYQTVGGETIEFRARQVSGKLLALEIQVLPATVQ